jgi:hypothetical protein
VFCGAFLAGAIKSMLWKPFRPPSRPLLNFLFSLFSSKLFDISLMLSMQLLLFCLPRLFNDMQQSWHGLSCYTIHTACIKHHLPCCPFLLIPCYALILHSFTVKQISRQPRHNVVESALCYTCYELQMFLGVTESQNMEDLWT